MANVPKSFYLQDGDKSQLAQIWNEITSLSRYVYPPEDGHPSKYKPGPAWVNIVHATNAANQYAATAANNHNYAEFNDAVYFVGSGARAMTSDVDVTRGNGGCAAGSSASSGRPKLLFTC